MKKPKTKPNPPVNAEPPSPVNAEPPPPAEADAIQQLRCADCSPGPVNRKYISEAEIAERAESIRQVGQLQPILVRPRPRYTLRKSDLVNPYWQILASDGSVFRNWTVEYLAQMDLEALNAGVPYEIVFGECRWRACNLLGRETIAAMVRELDDKQVLTMRLVENQQRQDLNALDEAAQMQAALDSGLFQDKAALAKEIGCKRSHVYSRLRLLTLPEFVQAELLTGAISPSIADLLATVTGEKLQKKALQDVLESGQRVWDESKQTSEIAPPSFRRARQVIESGYRTNLADAKFHLGDASLSATAGSCVECPKRSGNLDPDSPSPNFCTDPKCFTCKQDLHADAALAKYRKQGLETLSPEQSRTEFTYGSHLRYHSDFVRPQDEVRGDQKNRTYKQILKGSGVNPVMALDADGNPQEIYQLKAIAPVLEEKGVKIENQSSSSSKSSPADREADLAKAKLDQQVREILSDRVAAAVGKLCATEKPSKDLEHLLWALALDEALQSYDVTEDMEARHGKMQQNQLLKLPVSTLRAFFGEMLADQSYPSGPVERLKTLAGVDAKALEKTIRAELEPQPEPSATTPQKTKTKKGKKKRK